MEKENILLRQSWPEQVFFCTYDLQPPKNNISCGEATSATILELLVYKYLFDCLSQLYGITFYILCL